MQRKGFYLYAVRPTNPKVTFPEIKGIDKRGRVFTILVGDQMEAIVSLVSWKDFSAKAMKERAQNDLKWIQEKSVLHNEVIMRSMDGSEGMIVPMKFGLLFKTRQSLSSAVQKESAKFLELFQKLKGREEWSVKVYLHSDALERKIREENDEVKSKQREMSSLPAGIAYFKEKELQDTIEKIKNTEIHKALQYARASLCKYSEEERLGKILGKELTLRDDPMVLNVAFLISKKKLSKFLKELKKLKNVARENGLIIEQNGPWPPYNFANFPSDAKLVE